MDGSPKAASCSEFGSNEPRLHLEKLVDCFHSILDNCVAETSGLLGDQQIGALQVICSATATRVTCNEIPGQSMKGGTGTSNQFQMPLEQLTSVIEASLQGSVSRRVIKLLVTHRMPFP